ncbi:sodium/solute symporter [Haloferula chungangensis]|uniref:Sodium/solute symporter n=1 Tax=Haloferula chungangensis TaxID=1048331 RepID=A0ABW2L7P6_9BACT
MEIILFTIFVVGVIGLGIYQGNKTSGESEGGGASGYFLAGRGLTWWLVGFSLIAANISTEQFVGMSGQAAGNLGMAIASYEWMAAVTLVVVAFVFLPKFLKAGIYTAPEFLEYRYGLLSRMVMAVATLVILVGVPTASVIFSGAKVISVYYPDVPLLGNLTAACWLIALIAAAYVFVGGLKACAWTDLVWGASLILGGAIVAYLAFKHLGSMEASDLAKTATLKDIDVAKLGEAGSWERFKMLNAGTAEEGGKLHMQRPLSDPDIPWTALVLGLWIPNFFYWGLNQYIIQRTLGSKSLAEGQKGIIFAAFLKLIVPFVVVIPGILAFNMFATEMANNAGGHDLDASFPLLLKNLVKPHPWLSWFVLAAIFGAVISSLASMLNSASTIATMDLYHKAKPNASEKQLVGVGKVFVVLFVIIAAAIAPSLANPKFGGIFAFIQEFQGFISPGVLAVFIFGVLVPKAPRFLGWSGILLNAILYGAIKFVLADIIIAQGWWFAESISFLDRMGLCFILVMIYCGIMTLIKPLPSPIVLPENKAMNLDSSPFAKFAGAGVIVLTIILYIVFW